MGFLTATTNVMSLSDLLEAVKTVIQHVVGGGDVTFANSWVGMFLNTLTTSNGILLVCWILGICLFGLHVLLSLARR